MWPERLVFIAIAEAKDGNPLIEALTAVIFAKEDDGTRLTVHVSAVTYAADGARMLEGMEAGWTQSLERLEALLPVG